MPGDTLIDHAPSEVTPSEVTRAPAAAAPRRDNIRRCTECRQQFSSDAMFCPFDGTKLVTVSWNPSADGMIGKTIDKRYEVVSVLGEGGMGTVYEVRHTSLNRSFAMKVLRRDVAKDPDLANRFTVEAKATAAIKHPNVVSITDFGRLDDDTPYFVMELLVGETLADLIKRLGALPPARAARIVGHIAAGLRAAHESGVIHRDLKPENVFLVGNPTAAPDARDVIRVVDFGAAKIAGAARLTKMGVVFGTPHYMSPEQASGQAVDHRADIYAMGVIMYVMFTGRVPFEADTYMGILTQHMFVQPTPPSRLLEGGGTELGALEAVTLRALEKKPEDRYQSMAELASAIERVVTVTPAGAVEIAPRLDTPSRRAPALLAAMDHGDSFADGVPHLGISSPWKWPLLIAGAMIVGAAVVLGANWARARHAAAGEVASAAPSPLDSATPSETPPASSTTVAVAPAPAASLRITSTPSFAEVWSQGVRVGTTPYDVGADGAWRYVIRAPGYDDRVVARQDAQGHEVHVDLVMKPASQPARTHEGPPDTRGAPSHKQAPGELNDPWAK
jgi:eukaryotic-like serine/threonine-protein kinase